MKFLILVSCAAVLAGLFAQEPASRPRVGKEVRSPEVHSDGSVTFRFKAPNAAKVYLVSESIPTAAFVKDEHGVWSLTTKPLDPDLYCYQFAVDGSGIEDPGNPDSKPIVTGGHESIVLVPGKVPSPWETQNVPHGAIHFESFVSKTAGESREFCVYTPPGYEKSKASYPVLYLLHGVMEDDRAWSTAGRAPTILDNLIAQGNAKPMIVVMPTGYGFANVPDNVGQLLYSGPAVHKKLIETFWSSLRDEIMPLVANHYRVKRGAASTAIAGASMGASQSLFIGLGNPDRFGSVSSFSGAVIMFGQPFDNYIALKPPVGTLEISCGTEDFLIGPNRKFKEWLTAKGIPFRSNETKGGHTWNVWRRNLIDLVPRLFNR